MYFPYFRGKQFELLAIKESARRVSRDRKATPIIEPVKSNLSGLSRCLKKLMEFKAPYVLIINPIVGEFKGRNNSENLIAFAKQTFIQEYKKGIIGVLIHSDNDIDLLKELNGGFAGKSIALLHFKKFSQPEKVKEQLDLCRFEPVYNIFIGDPSRRYKRYFKKKKILVIDDFPKEKKNSEYRKESFFSDLFISAKEEGYSAGYGDFSIVGDQYTETGGPAYAVAIHITYRKNEDEIWVRHFLSDSNELPTNPAGKFGEALSKLAKAVKDKKIDIMETEALKTFLDLHSREHFPGLGFAKKLSMMHHLELNLELQK